MNEYRYDIERCLSMFAAEADKDVVRTCGNCCRYDAEHWLCGNEKAEDSDWHFKEDEGCYYHRTACEQRRLGVLIGEKRDRAERQRISEERETGSGQCEGCPFREKHKEMYRLLSMYLEEATRSVNYNYRRWINSGLTREGWLSEPGTEKMRSLVRETKKLLKTARSVE